MIGRIARPSHPLPLPLGPLWCPPLQAVAQAVARSVAPQALALVLVAPPRWVHLPCCGSCPPLAVSRVRGLKNLGNSCFFNAAVQLLAQLPDLRIRLSRSTRRAKESTSSITACLSRLVRQLRDDTDTTVRVIEPKVNHRPTTDQPLPSVCMYVCLFACVSIYLSVCMFVYLCVYLSIFCLCVCA